MLRGHLVNLLAPLLLVASGAEAVQPDNSAPPSSKEWVEPFEWSRESGVADGYVWQPDPPNCSIHPRATAEDIERRLACVLDAKRACDAYRFAFDVRCHDIEIERAVRVRLRIALRDASAVVRRRVAIALAWMGDLSTVPILVADWHAADATEDNVMVLARYLREPRLAPHLAIAAEHHDPWVRGMALYTLGLVRAEGALEILVAHLTDFECGPGCTCNPPAVSANAGLAQLGDPRAIPYLFAALQEPRTGTQAGIALIHMTGMRFMNDRERPVAFNHRQREQWLEWFRDKSPLGPIVPTLRPYEPFAGVPELQNQTEPASATVPK